MTADNISEPQYLLRKTLALHGPELVVRHPWVWETDRWKELVFVLLVEVSRAPEDRVRIIVSNLADLGLLDIPDLASIWSDGKEAALDRPLARRILDLLKESGFDQEVAERGLITICQAAWAFQTGYGGKVQRYLRSYGDLMLNDLDRIFQFSSFSHDDVRHAFTYWLQSVLNFPLSLTDENVRAYCEANHLTPAQLAAAADDLNLNVAVVDDLTALWVKSRSQEAKPDGVGAVVSKGA